MTDGLMPVMLPAQIPPCDGRGGKPSASGMERLCLCPGSWRAEQLCPEEAEGADAAAGTRLHKHMEEGSLPEDAAEAEAVEWCRRMERELVTEFLGCEDDPFERESRLWAQDGSFSGQPDVVYLLHGVALVIDYKFGRGGVAAAPGNLQLAALAVLVGQAYHAEEVYAAVLQPFVSRRRPAVVRYSREDLAAAEAYLAKAVKAAQEPGAPLCPGVRQCKYCRAKATCPAALQDAMSCQAVERWEELDAPTRAELWRRAQLARKLADAIEHKVKADLKAGAELPGLELAPGRSTFTVTDAQAAYNILAAELGISAEEFTACCKVQVTPLDKLVHGKRKAADASAKVKDSAAWLREALSSCADIKTTDGAIREVKGGAR